MSSCRSPRRHDRAIVAGVERPHLPVDGALRAVLIDHRRAADRVDGDERRRLREVRHEDRIAEIDRDGIDHLRAHQRVGRAAISDGEHIDTDLAGGTDGELRHDGGARRHFDREQLRQSRVAPDERLGAAEPVRVVGIPPGRPQRRHERFVQAADRQVERSERTTPRFCLSGPRSCLVGLLHGDDRRHGGGDGQCAERDHAAAGEAPGPPPQPHVLALEVVRGHAVDRRRKAGDGASERRVAEREVGRRSAPSGDPRRAARRRTGAGARRAPRWTPPRSPRPPRPSRARRRSARAATRRCRARRTSTPVPGSPTSTRRIRARARRRGSASHRASGGSSPTDAA